MKLLSVLIIIGIVIWFLDFMSPDNKRKRKEKFDAYAVSYEEKIAKSKQDSFKKGKAIGRTISTFLFKNTKNHSLQK